MKKAVKKSSVKKVVRKPSRTILYRQYLALRAQVYRYKSILTDRRLLCGSPTVPQWAMQAQAQALRKVGPTTRQLRRVQKGLGI